MGLIMKKITELEEQEKYYEICLYLMEKFKEEPKYLMDLFDLDSKADFTKAETKLLDKVKSFIGTPNEWVLRFARDSSFLDIRESKKNKELIKQIEKKLSKTHKKKAIALVENEWIGLELDHPDDNLPKVKVALSFDKEFFKIKAEVQDNHFLDGNRSWRYGDGFYLSFTMPDGKQKKACVDTNRFYNFGFSMEEGEPKAVLVNHNGKYYLRSDLDFPPEISIDKENKTATYKINIPFSYLKPFDVMIDEVSGFYIRYVSQQEGDHRKYVTLIDDIHADSEHTNYRRFVPVTYSFTEKSPFKLSGVLDNRLATKDTIQLGLKIYAPEEMIDVYSIQIADSNGNELLEIEKDVTLNKGMNSLDEELAILELKAGLYTISVTLKDEICVNSFYKFKDADLKEIETKIQALTKLGDTIQNLNSVHTIEYLIQQAKKQILEFHPRDDPSDIYEMLQTINDSIKNCAKNKSIFTKSGYSLAAIKSPFDNTLQPYSLVFPGKYDSEKEYTLLVSLHGSGVDEVGFLRYMGEKLGELGVTSLILVGPRGRHLSDHYSGQSEIDVVDIITNAKKMFKIKSTLIFGFSMGGYGTWRMTLKHPELFDGAFIAAGFPSFGTNEDDDMRNHIGKTNDVDFFVIHGTADRSVSIKSTDEFIEKLKKAGYSVRYERIEGEDHGNLSIEKYVPQWLGKYLQ
jgi:predicted esterase